MVDMIDRVYLNIYLHVETYSSFTRSEQLVSLNFGLIVY